MKEMISYLYKINIISEKKYNGEVIYKTSSSNYLYREVSDINRVMIMDKYTKYFNTYHFFSYTFKPNIYNEIISKYEDKNFVILDIGNDFQKEVDFTDMLDFYNKSSLILFNRVKYNNNWETLWESKINYLVSHFNNNKIDNKKYNILFNYYVSIADTSLLYLSRLKRKNSYFNYSVSFVHRRIDSSNSKLFFYNPLNFIIDIKIRDISEYIKSLFYSDKDYLGELEYFFKTHKLDTYLASMLYARIVYPSIFFDSYEQNKIDIKKFIDFDKHKDFIKKIYDVISSYIYIDKIDYLK